MNRLARAESHAGRGNCRCRRGLAHDTDCPRGGPSVQTIPLNCAPAGNTVFLIGHAKGFQIYRATATSRTSMPAGDRLPRTRSCSTADGELIAKHFAGPTGPTWQAKDGSSSSGRWYKDGVGLASLSILAIPWLLLEKVSTTARPPRQHDVHPAGPDHRRPSPCPCRLQCRPTGRRQKLPTPPTTTSRRAPALDALAPVRHLPHA